MTKFVGLVTVVPVLRCAYLLCFQVSPGSCQQLLQLNAALLQLPQLAVGPATTSKKDEDIQQSARSKHTATQYTCSRRAQAKTSDKISKHGKVSVAYKRCAMHAEVTIKTICCCCRALVVTKQPTGV